MLLQVHNLSLKIGQTRICKNLHFELPAGSSMCILGPNGAGKTTLLLALALLRPSAAGELLFKGRSLAKMTRRQRARQLGLVFQMEREAFSGSVLEAALSGRYPHLGRFGWEQPSDLDIAWQALVDVGLDALAQRPAAHLSGGERQRLEIASLLVQQPDLALLDEPSNHLDPGQQIQILDLLHDQFCTEGKGLIMVLHDVNLALRYSDYLLMLKGQGEWRFGKTRLVGCREQIQWLYQHPVTEHHHCIQFI